MPRNNFLYPLKFSLNLQFLFILFFIFICFSSYGLVNAKEVGNTRRMHTQYFENTDYELHVYRIFGEKKGKTIMILGGIQGDEPGGFLTADTYADISLEKGNLIVVPRANLPSILLQKRSVNVDMNRKFADEDANDYEGKIVKILKALISESDCLLNLHDGSGFFSPVWVNEMKNPMRFGQSVIADFKRYKTDSGTELKLADIATRVVKNANKKIINKDLSFSFNNHRTSEKNTKHKEQRKSATYFAVTKCNIPAFGIETSKSLSIIKKVKYHQYVINAFLEEFDVIPELPPLVMEKPRLKYVVLSVNNTTPIVLKKGETLYVNKGDKVRVSHVEANYDRGLTIDFIDLGNKNDIRTSLRVEKDLRVVARKDYEPCGSIYIKIGNSSVKNKNVVVSSSLKGDYFFFKTRMNKKEIRYVNNMGKISLKRGDLFEIVDIETGLHDPSELEVNIKGYVNNRANNTGEDRGFVVDTAKELWTKYSLDKKGAKYPVIVKKNNEIVGKMVISIEPVPEKYLIVRSGVDKFAAVKEGVEFKVDKGIEYQIESISGISINELGKGEFILKCNGRKYYLPEGKISLSSLFTHKKRRAEIELVKRYDDVEKIEAKFNIVK